MANAESKKVYAAPVVEVHGSMQELTRGATGAFRDGGSGSPKSKASGGA
jgi:hypothetical protein